MFIYVFFPAAWQTMKKFPSVFPLHIALVLEVKESDLAKLRKDNNYSDNMMSWVDWHLSSVAINSTLLSVFSSLLCGKKESFEMKNE